MWGGFYCGKRRVKGLKQGVDEESQENGLEKVKDLEKMSKTINNHKMYIKTTSYPQDQQNAESQIILLGEHHNGNSLT